MSIVSAGGKLGISYYCPDTTVLYMMPDVAETDGYDMLKKGKYLESLFHFNWCLTVLSQLWCHNIKSWIVLHYMPLRRIKSDLVLCYKIIVGIADLNTLDFFDLATTSTRGH